MSATLTQKKKVRKKYIIYNKDGYQMSATLTL